MIDEVLHQRGVILVRRLILDPGEAMPWHTDPFVRLSVVLHGENLAIEYRDGSSPERIELTAGQVDWDEPTDRIHRGVNTGRRPYEEITVFFLDRPDSVPQPRQEE